MSEKEYMEPEKIIFETDDGEEAFYILDETRINGVNYLLVTDAEDPDAEEIDVIILKDVSKDDDEERLYEVVTDDEEIVAVAPLFEESMGDVDISQ